MQHPLHEHIGKDGFRLRGTAMSRIDGFSDVVFGFALTLIVVSLEVPKTYAEFHETLLGFVPFAICFVFLFMVWWSHFRFFRRYGLHDIGTILINAALLFTVLFYVYPLKFLFNVIALQVLGRATSTTPVFTESWQGREMMSVYGIGFAATYFCISALYFNAYRQRRHLHLSTLEKTLTLSYAWDDFGVACVGLICVIVAHLLPPNQAGTAGWCFFLIGPWKTAHGFVAGRYIRAARARLTAEDRAALHHG
jgi:uncharacterized membrane protein